MSVEDMIEVLNTVFPYNRFADVVFDDCHVWIGIRTDEIKDEDRRYLLHLGCKINASDISICDE